MSDKDAANAILLEEYRALWLYYMRTLDERGRIFDLYFKIVSVPFVLTGAVVVTLRSLGQFEAGRAAEVAQRLDLIIQGASIFFILAAIAGLACYAYYALESANSRTYLVALTAIRNAWRRNPELADGVVVDLLRTNIKIAGGIIVHARGVVLAVFNSALVAVSLWFALGHTLIIAAMENLVLTLAIFLLSIAGHVALGVVCMNVYASRRQRTSIARSIQKTAREQQLALEAAGAAAQSLTGETS